VTIEELIQLIWPDTTWGWLFRAVLAGLVVSAVTAAVTELGEDLLPIIGVAVLGIVGIVVVGAFIGLWPMPA
jgi:hypothetical protein